MCLKLEALFSLCGSLENIIFIKGQEALTKEK